MTAAFTYRPKFVDIRVNPPADGGESKIDGDRLCDHVGCRKAGGHKAPKSREGSGEYWFFCREHAGEYNRRWDYFKDMSDADLAAHQRAEEVGHRPVWKFRPGRGDRVSAPRFWQAAKPGDTFGLFGGAARVRPEKPRKRGLSRVETLALDVLALEEDADAVIVRARYAELVKRYHPDSNGGDRSAEMQLQKVIRAFKALKAAGRA
jgi:DnaJ domain